MATESILPLTIDHSSLKKKGNGSTPSGCDPLLDLDSILLSADFQATDTLFSELMATDEDFLNEFLNLPPSNASTSDPILSSSPASLASPTMPLLTSSSTSYDHHQMSPPFQQQGQPFTAMSDAHNHSPVGSSEGQFSPPPWSWEAASSSSGAPPNVTYGSSPGQVSGSGSLLDERSDFVSSLGQNGGLDSSLLREERSSVSDVHIDFEFEELEEDEEEMGDDGPADRNKGLSSSASRKTGSLVLSEEEKRLLSEEGIHLPTDMPLTKAEERHLKRIRRKIKNKQSAAESRKRKKEYVSGLEKRVEMCTAENVQCKRKIKVLETENKSLLSQLQKLQAMVTQYSPSKLQAGSFLMVMMLSFSLLVFPNLLSPHTDAVTTGTTRTLLNVNADEFGNVIDPNTGRILKDMSPIPQPPWKYQSVVQRLISPSKSPTKDSPDL